MKGKFNGGLTVLTEIKLVKHLDETLELIELFRLCFNSKMSQEYWYWKYVANPFVDSNPEVIVAVEGGQIIGARPFLLTQMWLNNSKVIAAQHCDTMVHPEHRNKGLFNKMGEYSIRFMRERNYAFSYGFPGPMSRPGFLKQGYRIVAPTEILFKPQNSSKILARKIKNKMVGNTIGFIIDKVLTSKEPDFPSQAGYSIKVVSCVPPDLHVVDTWKEHVTIDLVRSQKLLDWRFGLHPKHTYKYILVNKEQTLKGYAVVSVQEQADGTNQGILIDYLTKDEDSHCLNLLFGRVIAELKKSKCDIIIIWALNEPEFQKEVTKNFGLRSSFRFPYNKIIGYSYMDAMQIDNKTVREINIYDKNNWRITNAFTDFT
jgi:hypothetical protein